MVLFKRESRWIRDSKYFKILYCYLGVQKGPWSKECTTKQSLFFCSADFIDWYISLTISLWNPIYHCLMFSKSFPLNTNPTFQYSLLSLWIMWCSVISPKSSWAKPEPALESHLSVFDHELNSKHFLLKLAFLQVLVCAESIYSIWEELCQRLWCFMIYPWGACTTRTIYVFFILDCSQSNLWQLILKQPNSPINQLVFWHWALHFPPGAEEGLRSCKILLSFTHGAFQVVPPLGFSLNHFHCNFYWTLYKKFLAYIIFKYSLKVVCSAKR